MLYRFWRTHQSRHRSKTWCIGLGSIIDVYPIGDVSKNSDVIVTSPFSYTLPLCFRLLQTPQSRHRSQTWCTGSFDDVYSIGGGSKNSDVIVTSPFISILPLWYWLWRIHQLRHRSQTWCTTGNSMTYIRLVVSATTMTSS